MVDTHKFCVRFSRPEGILVCIYTIFALVGCLTGLAIFDKRDYFGFYEVNVQS